MLGKQKKIVSRSEDLSELVSSFCLKSDARLIALRSRFF